MPYSFRNLGLVDLASLSLAGKSVKMCMAENQTEVLWTGFMKELMPLQKGVRPDNLYSVEVFPEVMLLKDFTPRTVFQKQATMEAQEAPPQMKLESLPKIEGKYLKLIYEGPVSSYHEFAAQLFGVILPEIDLEVDDRPHFNRMTSTYLGEHPKSQEEVFVPVG